VGEEGARPVPEVGSVLCKRAAAKARLHELTGGVVVQPKLIPKAFQSESSLSPRLTCESSPSRIAQAIQQEVLSAVSAAVQEIANDPLMYGIATPLPLPQLGTDGFSNTSSIPAIQAEQCKMALTSSKVYGTFGFNFFGVNTHSCRPAKVKMLKQIVVRPGHPPKDFTAKVAAHDENLNPQEIIRSMFLGYKEPLRSSRFSVAFELKASGSDISLVAIGDVVKRSGTQRYFDVMESTANLEQAMRMGAKKSHSIG